MSRRSLSTALGRGMAAARFAAAAGNQPPPTGPHLDTLAGAPAEVRQIMADHTNAMRELRGQATSDSAAERQRITKLAEPVQARTQQRLADLGRRVDTAHESLRTAAERALPAPAGGVEGILGRQAHWARAKSMLDSGLSPADVISEATDPEQLHALAAELPTYLRTQGATPDNAQNAVPAVFDRLAEVTGGPAADARLAARTADVHRAGLGPLIRHAGHAAMTGPFDEQRSAFGAAIPAAIAGQLARESVAAGGLPHSADVEEQAEPGELAGRIGVAMQRAARSPRLNSQPPTPPSAA